MHGQRAMSLRDIRNEKEKLVCRLDEKRRIVEIVAKGCKTVIHFRPDGTVKIIGGK